MKWKAYFLAVLLFSLVNPAFAKVIEKECIVKIDGISHKNFVVYDDQIEGTRPGIIVVHEWWGPNNYARKRASMLARLGYTAVAADMYGNAKVARHPKDAKEFATTLLGSFPELKARFEASLMHLKKHHTVDNNRIFAIGYCMGGTVVLNIARATNDVKAVVSFHGGLDPITTPMENINTKILICHGAKDTDIGESIPAFEAEMKKHHADFKINVYENAHHSFTNPSASRIGAEFDLPVQYNPLADRESWADMLKFLNANS